MQENAIQEKDLFYKKAFKNNNEEQVHVWAKEYYLAQQAYAIATSEKEKNSLENQKEALALGIDSLLLWACAQELEPKEQEMYYRNIQVNIQSLRERADKEFFSPQKIQSIEQKLLHLYNQKIAVAGFSHSKNNR